MTNTSDMKTKAILMTCLLVLQISLVTAGNDRNESRVSGVNEVNVVASPETEALATAWIEAFRVANPDAKVNIVSQDRARPSDIHIIAAGSAGFVNDPGTWKIVVGREVIVPVMNETDPCYSLISGRGLSPVEFSRIISSDGSLTWGKLLGTDSNIPVTAIIPDDNAALASIAGFTALDQALITAARQPKGTVTASLSGSKSGTVVFCRLSDITDRTGQEFAGGVRIVPVDINSNAKSDYFEQFYAGFDSFNRGVYIGKYPKSLCNSIYAASSMAPSEGAAEELISFLLIDGQRFVAASGFTALAYGEGLLRRDALISGQEIIATTSEKATAPGAWLWIIAVIAVVSLMAYVVYRVTRALRSEPEPAVYRPSAPFSPRSLIIPAGIMYDRSHSWSFMEKDGTVKVGIDDFLQHVTGPITRIQMKSTGEKVRKGEHVVSIIQNGKKLDIQSPVSGTVLARNERLMNETGIVNSSPYDEGWVYSVQPDNWEKESSFMIPASRFADYLREEFARIKDFLAVMPGVNDIRLANVVLQDGGELRDGLLGEFGPEIWEEFQMRFLDQRR